MQQGSCSLFVAIYRSQLFCFDDLSSLLYVCVSIRVSYSFEVVKARPMACETPYAPIINKNSVQIS
jgi:hypothetical protein